MKIVYLHGFNSNSKGDSAQKLKALFNEKMILVDYDYINPDKAFEQIKSVIENLQKTESNIIIAGSSLGGFWANYFAQKYILKCVLNNPAVKPSTTLQVFIGENKNYSTGEVKVLTKEDCEKYKKYEGPINKKTFRVVRLGRKDDVLKFENSIKAFKNSEIVITNEGHRLENEKEFADIIKKAANLFPE